MIKWELNLAEVQSICFWVMYESVVEINRHIALFLVDHYLSILPTSTHSTLFFFCHGHASIVFDIAAVLVRSWSFRFVLLHFVSFSIWHNSLSFIITSFERARQLKWLSSSCKYSFSHSFLVWNYIQFYLLMINLSDIFACKCMWIWNWVC